jgi:hypothetical protein
MAENTLNFMEIAEKYVKGELSYNDDRLKKAQDFLAELASTEDGRQEIAETIAIYLDQNFNKFDIAPYLCTYRNFNLGDKPEFRLKKKGIKAYWIAPNSSTPKSRNYQETLTMEFDSLSVRPEAMIDELKAGRIQGFAELVRDAKQAMVDAIAGQVFTILGQVYNETGIGKDNYKEDTSALSQTSLNTALDNIFYKTGVRPVIIGDMLLTNQIRDFDGYTEDIKTQITRTGVLGAYRGSIILPLPEILDPVTGKSLVPTNRLYIASSKIGYAGTYGTAKAGQETSIEDWSWNARIDKEWGMTVTDPKGLQVIEVV